MSLFPFLLSSLSHIHNLLSRSLPSHAIYRHTYTRVCIKSIENKNTRYKCLGLYRYVQVLHVSSLRACYFSHSLSIRISGLMCVGVYVCVCAKAQGLIFQINACISALSRRDPVLTINNECLVCETARGRYYDLSDRTGGAKPKRDSPTLPPYNIAYIQTYIYVHTVYIQTDCISCI